MMSLRIFRVAAPILLTAGLALAQPRSMDQDPSLNNLVHPPDYSAAPNGTFGHVEKRGDGPIPMVLIPGGGFPWSVFESFMEAHRSAYTMYAVTLAGMGGTAAPAMPPAGTSYGERTWLTSGVGAVRDLIEREGLERPVLVGHFLEGTYVALKTAVDHPSHVRAVVSLGGAIRFASAQFDQFSLDQRVQYLDTVMAPNWFKTVTLETWNDNNFPASAYSRQPNIGSALFEQVSNGPLQVFIRYLLEFWAGDLTPELASLSTPVLALAPTFEDGYKREMEASFLDDYFVTSWANVASNPHIRVEPVPDAHIFVWMDQPDFVAGELKRFIHTHP